MKKYRIIIVLIGLTIATFNSCNKDTVDLTPIGDTEAAFFQNEAQMRQAVLGIYQKQTFFYQWASDEGILQRVELLPSDDITVVGNWPHENFVSLNGSDSHTNDIYRFAYQLIARANTVLQKIEENGSEVYPENSDLDDYNKGEALFLRSHMYFKLWNTYGTAPLITERITNLENAFPPNSTGTELLDQAIADFTEAMALLPDSWDGDNLGRATKNSAKGMLIKTLVFRGTVTGNTADFGTAITVFNGITGVALAPNYDDNFDYSKENNIESMFEFQANKQYAEEANPWVGGGGGNDTFAVIGEINTYYAYFTGGAFGGGEMFYPTQSLIDTYEVGDPRLSLIFDDSSGETRVIKYITHDELFTEDILSGNNQRILRYADVILLAAEAIVRSGGTISDAMDLVNLVRERARNSGDTPSLIPADIIVMPATADDALDVIFTERRMELAAEEGHRWYDMRRRHMASEIDLTSPSYNFGSLNSDFSFQAFNINFPLPDNEVIQNPSLNQNTGY